MNSPLKLNAIGIDVGFHSTKFTLGRSGDLEGKPILVDQFPSLTPMPSIRPVDLPGSLPSDGTFIKVEGQTFFVGKTSPQVTGPTYGFRPASLTFSTTPDYKALLNGALYYICRHHQVREKFEIQHLVLGLPMSSVFTYAHTLVEMASGVHHVELPEHPQCTVQVLIHKVHVIAQPQGCLINHGARIGSTFQDQEVLVLDMGGGTFDWFLAEGLRPKTSCGAASIGMIECAGAICDQINPTFKQNPSILRRVDLAMREGSTSLDLEGIRYKMDDLWPSAESVLLSALEQMDRQIGGTATVQHVIPTGGGASVLERVLPRRFPKLVGRIERDSDPIYSNVKGFHLLGERLFRMQKGN